MSICPRTVQRREGRDVFMRPCTIFLRELPLNPTRPLKLPRSRCPRVYIHQLNLFPQARVCLDVQVQEELMAVFFNAIYRHIAVTAGHRHMCMVER